MCYANFLQDLKLGVAGGQIETAGRFFEPSEEESERMVAETTRRTRHVPTSLLTQRPHSGPALVPRFGPELPLSRSTLQIEWCTTLLFNGRIPAAVPGAP